jgi:hypothetical protein
MATPHPKSTRSIGPAAKRVGRRKAMPVEAAGAKTLIKIYRWALTKSDRSGRAVRIIVDFKPNRRPKFTKVVTKPASERETAATPMDDPNLQQALTRARERGRSGVAEILGGDDMLSADAFANLLGTTRVTVNAKRQNRQVLGLEGAIRGFRFPQWQVGPDGKPFSALPDLFERLGDDGWAVYRFLVQRHPELDGLSGREALQQGKRKQALEAAESVARNSA